MAVLCLMYHHTPIGSAQSQWDVPLERFKEQVDRLLDAGVSFVGFDNVPEAVASDRVSVSITFDDGHSSNAPAFEFLASRSIRPMAFIVSDWSRNAPAFLDSSAIKDLAGICDFGAHGASHIGLSTLSEPMLHAELTDASTYLADILGKPTTSLALPGGDGGRRELRAAKRAGYNIVGNSVTDLNRKSGFTVNRPCVVSHMSAHVPTYWAQAASSYWLKKGVLRSVSRTSVGVLGEARHAAMARTLKRLVSGRSAV